MRRFVEEADRGQWTLLPECLDDFIDESNPVRVIDVFVGALDLAEMSFEGVEPAATGRPSYHPSVLLKLYIYGYLNRVQSSRRLEREAGRNVEVMWLLGRLAPDHKTIADFISDASATVTDAEHGGTLTALTSTFCDVRDTQSVLGLIAAA
jgi:transposase